MLFSNGDWYKGEWRNDRLMVYGTAADSLTAASYTGTLARRLPSFNDRKYIASSRRNEAECEATDCLSD